MLSLSTMNDVVRAVFAKESVMMSMKRSRSAVELGEMSV